MRPDLIAAIDIITTAQMAVQEAIGRHGGSYALLETIDRLEAAVRLLEWQRRDEEETR